MQDRITGMSFETIAASASAPHEALVSTDPLAPHSPIPLALSARITGNLNTIFYHEPLLNFQPPEAVTYHAEAPAETEQQAGTDTQTPAQPDRTPTKAARRALAREQALYGLIDQIQSAREQGPLATRSGRLAHDHTRIKLAKRKPL